MKKYVIALSFYEKYINSLYRGLSEVVGGDEKNSYVIVLIDNGGNHNYLKDKFKAFGNLVLLNGDNSSWEFSGWDVGVNYLIDNHLLGNDDICYFLNDTFNNHRIFNRLNLRIFESELKKIKGSRFILGEKNSCYNPLLIENIKIKEWISTYFFVMDGESTINLFPFTKTSNKKLVKSINKNKIHYDKILSKSFQNYVSRWIFPKPGAKGWYKNKDSQLPEELINGKVKAIYNEKSLSKNGQIENIILHDVYCGVFNRAMKKAQSFLFRIKSKYHE